MAGTNKAYDSIGLLSWPFNVVPDPEANLIWADRKGLLSQIKRMLRGLKSEPSSTLHLLWADFGAGKTHTMLYVRQLALSGTYGNILPVYLMLPRESRSFIDVYRAVVKSIGIETLVETYRKIPRESRGGVYSVMYQVSKDLPKVFDALDGSEAMMQSAQRWIIADASLTRRETYAASLPDKIRTTDDAVYALSVISRLLIAGGFQRVLIMVDEFQRAGFLRKEKQNDINAGLHTLFNNCPKGLSIILSFSFGSAKEIKHYLSKELADRANLRTLEIPALGENEGREFLQDLIDSARSPDRESPIDEECVSAIVQYVASISKLKPRTLIQACGTVLSEGMMDLTDGVITSIDAQYVNEILKSIGTVTDQESEED